MREGIVSDRRRIIDDALYSHFVTFSVYRRRRLLDHDHPKRIVLGVLNAVLESFAARCVGFVLMPDHVHAVLWLRQTGQLSAFMHEWKRQSSLQVRSWMREEAPKYFEEAGEGDNSGSRGTTHSRSTNRQSWKRSSPTCISIPCGPGWSRRQRSGSGVRHVGMRTGGPWECRFNGSSEDGPWRLPSAAFGAQRVAQVGVLAYLGCVSDGRFSTNKPPLPSPHR